MHRLILAFALLAVMGFPVAAIAAPGSGTISMPGVGVTPTLPVTSPIRAPLNIGASSVIDPLTDPTGGVPTGASGATTTTPDPAQINAAFALMLSQAQKSCVTGIGTTGTNLQSAGGMEGVLRDTTNPNANGNPNTNAPSISHVAYTVGSYIFMAMGFFSIVLWARKWFTDHHDVVSQFVAMEVKMFGLAMAFLAMQFAAGEGVFQSNGGTGIAVASQFVSAISAKFAPSFGVSGTTDTATPSFKIDNPGDAFAIGNCMAWKVMAVPTLAGGAAAIKQSQGRDAWDVMGSVTDGIAGIASAFIVGILGLINGLGVELVYIALAIQIFLVKWSALVIGAIGVLFLGFEAFDRTRPWAEGYWKFFYAILVGFFTITVVAIFVTGLLDRTELAIVNELAASASSTVPVIDPTISAGIAFGGVAAPALLALLKTFFIVILSLGIVLAIPAITSSFMTGSGGLAAGNLLAAGALIGGSGALMGSALIGLKQGISKLAEAVKKTAEKSDNSVGEGAAALSQNSVGEGMTQPVGNPAAADHAAPAHDDSDVGTHRSTSQVTSAQHASTSQRVGSGSATADTDRVADESAIAEAGTQAEEAAGEQEAVTGADAAQAAETSAMSAITGADGTAAATLAAEESTAVIAAEEAGAAMSQGDRASTLRDGTLSPKTASAGKGAARAPRAARNQQRAGASQKPGVPSAASPNLAPASMAAQFAPIVGQTQNVVAAAARASQTAAAGDPKQITAALQALSSATDGWARAVDAVSSATDAGAKPATQFTAQAVATDIEHTGAATTTPSSTAASSTPQSAAVAPGAGTTSSAGSAGSAPRSVQATGSPTAAPSPAAAAQSSKVSGATSPPSVSGSSGADSVATTPASAPGVQQRARQLREQRSMRDAGRVLSRAATALQGAASLAESSPEVGSSVASAMVQLAGATTSLTTTGMSPSTAAALGESTSAIARVASDAASAGAPSPVVSALSAAAAALGVETQVAGSVAGSIASGPPGTGSGAPAARRIVRRAGSSAGPGAPVSISSTQPVAGTATAGPTGGPGPAQPSSAAPTAGGSGPVAPLGQPQPVPPPNLADFEAMMTRAFGTVADSTSTLSEALREHGEALRDQGRRLATPDRARSRSDFYTSLLNRQTPIQRIGHELLPDHHGHMVPGLGRGE